MNPSLFMRRKVCSRDPGRLDGFCWNVAEASSIPSNGQGGEVVCGVWCLTAAVGGEPGILYGSLSTSLIYFHTIHIQKDRFSRTSRSVIATICSYPVRVGTGLLPHFNNVIRTISVVF